MGTIADAKFTHNYNCYNRYFVGCLQRGLYRMNNKWACTQKIHAHYCYRVLYPIFRFIYFQLTTRPEVG